jgi:hypothetical protein
MAEFGHEITSRINQVIIENTFFDLNKFLFSSLLPNGGDT